MNRPLAHLAAAAASCIVGIALWTESVLPHTHLMAGIALSVLTGALVLHIRPTQ
jgi:ABC-type Fe3+-siderophore transport system permease subunit